MQRSVESELELVGEPLGNAIRDELDRRAVICRAKCGQCFVYDCARRGVGEKTFRAESIRDPGMATAVRARLLWDDQDDDAGVACPVPRSSGATHLPLSSDLERNVRRVAAFQVCQRDDDDLAA